MKKFLALMFFVLLCSTVQAQKGDYELPQQSSITDRLYYGGGFGLGGGSGGISISLSPIVGFMVSNRVSLGLGITYRYYKYEDSFTSYSDNQWGGQVFGRINIIRPLFAMVQYSFLNYSYRGDQNDRRVVERLPIGLGISQPIGGRSAINITAGYDVLYIDNNGPYGSPWVFAVFFSI